MIGQKAGQLAGLGVDAWDRLVVVSEPHDLAKASYMASAGTDIFVDIFVDNRDGNLAAAAAVGVPLCLRPYSSQEP